MIEFKIEKDYVANNTVDFFHETTTKTIYNDSIDLNDIVRGEVDWKEREYWGETAYSSYNNTLALFDREDIEDKLSEDNEVEKITLQMTDDKADELIVDNGHYKRRFYPHVVGEALDIIYNTGEFRMYFHLNDKGLLMIDIPKKSKVMVVAPKVEESKLGDNDD